MAKAGIEGAVWDLYAKRQKKSLATLLGGTKSEIEVGVCDWYQYNSGYVKTN